jgi:3-oxoacyl-[acyl-carrier-protein] synthase II
MSTVEGALNSIATRDETRRIVITGLGLVTPLGVGTEHVWRRLLNGRSGICRLSDDIVSDVASKVGGVVPTLEEDPEAGFDLDRVVPSKEQKKMDRFIHFALAAADEALAQAGWAPSTEEERDRTATVIASGIGGFPGMMEAAATTASRGVRRLSPFTVPSFLVNLAAGQVSIRHGFRGPIGAPVTACAASVQAIGDAARLILSGEAEIAVAGGAEACLDRVALGGFTAARALSTGFNDRPQEASRPFDRSRDGFVMGEGAGMFVLETLAHAQARGARPIVELLGYGTSADAFHITSGPPDGAGAQMAMRRALRQAGISAAMVGYLNAHSTSTQLGDASELAAIRAVFGDIRVPISSTKSATGHLLGAAGGIEAVFTALALRDGLLPPTLNLAEPDEGAGDLDLIGPQARSQPIEVAMSNGFGFGGVNATIILGRLH